MKSASTQLQTDPRVQPRLGIAALTRRAYHGKDLAPVASRILATMDGTAADAAAMMDLSVIEQLSGNLSAGMDYQDSALANCQLFETHTKYDHDLDLLILAAPIHMGGNTPVDFLLANSTVRQTWLYLTPDAVLPSPLPAHDVAFVAAPGDCDATRKYLDEITRITIDWPTPVLNMPARIAGLERDNLCLLPAARNNILIPTTLRRDRQSLNIVAQGLLSLTDVLPQLDWPIVMRPVGSHAGSNLEKLASAAELNTYLSTCGDDDFFLTEFIDYSSRDGQFRKYRIIFVDGTPHPCHMAIADQWSVWYLNADMQQSSAKRAEEEAFMDGFSNDFAARHHTALSAITTQVGLDYFGIDCAEHRDGRLIVFEADNALIVHDMDPPHMFPYKQCHMTSIFGAFEKLLYDKAGRAPAL